MELTALVAVLGACELRGERRVRFEPVAVGVNVDLRAEPRVRRRAVVALEEVLDDDLPVRVRTELDARMELDRVHVELAREDRGQLAEVIGERLGTGIGVDEEKRPPRADARGQQRQLVVVEAGLTVRARRRAQRPVELVRPRVVVALERRAFTAAVGEHRPAVPADVQERTELAVAVARDDDRHASRIGRDERLRVRPRALRDLRTASCARRRGHARPAGSTRRCTS